MLSVTIGELTKTEAVSVGDYGNVMKGVQAVDLTPRTRRRFDIPHMVKVVQVTAVDAESPAYGLLRHYDVFQEVNREEIQSTDDYMAIPPGNSIPLLVYRDGGYLYIAIKSW